MPLLEQIDELVEGGRFETRADAVRAGIEQLVDQEHRRRVGDEIVESYTRLPQSEDVDEDLGDFPPSEPGDA